MSPILEERYPYLAAEEKWGKISPYLSFALDSRPNTGDYPIDKYIKVYGYDILTIAILSDSPLSAPIAPNFEGALNGAWRLLNKIWALRLELKSPLSFPTEKINIAENNKIITKIHVQTANLIKDFDEIGYDELLKNMVDITPNFYLYLKDDIKKSGFVK